MYDAIEKATDASIKPTPTNDKIETRMGNIESKTDCFLLLKLCLSVSLSLPPSLSLSYRCAEFNYSETIGE